MSERGPTRVTRRTALKWGALAAAAPALGGLPLQVFASADSVVLRWNEAALQGVRDSRLGPPMVLAPSRLSIPASLMPGPLTTIAPWVRNLAGLSVDRHQSAPWPTSTRPSVLRRTGRPSTSSPGIGSASSIH